MQTSVADQAIRLVCPPDRSSISPAAGAPAALPQKPIIEWTANVAPRSSGLAFETVPAVSEAESSMMVMLYAAAQSRTNAKLTWPEILNATAMIKEVNPNREIIFALPWERHSFAPQTEETMPVNAMTEIRPESHSADN